MPESPACSTEGQKHEMPCMIQRGSSHFCVDDDVKVFFLKKNKKKIKKRKKPAIRKSDEMRAIQDALPPQTKEE